MTLNIVGKSPGTAAQLLSNIAEVSYADSQSVGLRHFVMGNDCMMRAVKLTGSGLERLHHLDIVSMPRSHHQNLDR